MKVLLTGIFVNDPIKAFRFYTEILGFKEKAFVPDANLAIVISSEDPEGTSLILEPNTSPVAKSYQEGLYHSNIPAIVFGVKDIRQEYERLKKLGVVFIKEPTKSAVGTETVFDDNFGNLIQLYQLD
ncbi:VOC family protein [Leptospira barantonii]|uniref:Glyoxalase n=1 Tax=Leptospira barantonii TaxID=2023184 RepID=A0ABX4NQD7_9LEPT|nr:VOC family protein [Leptospira barantonii]PJZ58973.1 glyoxalase [Leptospira barantonii]